MESKARGMLSLVEPRLYLPCGYRRYWCGREHLNVD